MRETGIVIDFVRLFECLYFGRRELRSALFNLMIDIATRSQVETNVLATRESANKLSNLTLLIRSNGTRDFNLLLSLLIHKVNLMSDFLAILVR